MVIEKHHTATAFLLHHTGAEWVIGLILHPRHGHWTMPGGHVEPGEHPAGTARREILEETGEQGHLVGIDVTAASGARLPAPEWIIEIPTTAEPRCPKDHVHVDHFFVAVSNRTRNSADAEHGVRWSTARQLDEIEMPPYFRNLARRVLAAANDGDLDHCLSSTTLSPDPKN